ncbi:MAG: ATP-binding protein [Acidobacteriota bacterium]
MNEGTPPGRSQRIALLLVLGIGALSLLDLVWPGTGIDLRVRSGLLGAGLLLLLPLARVRGTAAAGVGAAALMLAAGGALLWGDVREQTIEREWETGVRPRLARRADGVEAEFAQLLGRLSGPAALLAAEPFAGAYSTDLEPSPALFELLDGLRAEAGLEDFRFGLELLDSLGRSVAWSGITSILPATAVYPVHGRAEVFQVLDSQAGTRLLHLSQVGDTGNVLVVEYRVQDRFERGLPADFLPLLPRTLGAVPVQFQDHLVSQAELQAIFEPRGNRYWGGNEPSPTLMFPLTAPSGEVLAIAIMRSRTPESVARQAGQRAAGLACLLLALAVSGVLLRGPRPRGPVATLALRSGGLWLVRLLLVRGQVPSSLIDLRAFDFEHFASPALGGLMRSPGDFLLTGLTLLVQGMLLLAFVREWLPRRRARPRARLAMPDGGLSAAALIVVLAGLAAVALRAFDGLVRNVVASSNLDLLQLRLDYLRPDVILLHAALLASALALGLGLAAAGWLLGTLRGRSVGSGPGPLGLPPGVRLRAAALPMLVAAAVVVYPMLLGAYEDAVRSFYEEDLLPRVLEHRNLHRVALVNSIDALDRDVELAERMATDRGGFDELAFDRWSRSSLARQGLNSSIELLDPTGRVLGQFALNMPPIGREMRRAEETPEVEREILQSSDSSTEALHASRAVRYRGRTVGYVLLHVLDTAENLPFLSSSDPYTQFFRRPGRRPPEETAFGEPVLYDYDPSDAPRGGGTAPEVPPLGNGAASGEWHRVPSPSGEPLDLLFVVSADGIYALGHRAPDVLGRVGGFIRLALLYATVGTLGIVAALLALGLRHPSSLRPSRLLQSLGRSYYRKLFATFVTASLVPLLTLAVFLQGFIGREIRQELVVKGGQSLDAAARILTRITADPVVPTVDDGIMELIRNMVGTDVHLYVEDRLLATSRRELVTAGLLSAKLAGPTFRDIYLERKLVSETRTLENGREVTLLASPVNLGDLREKAVLALHVHARPGIVEAQVSSVEDAILIATTLLVLLLAGTGFLGARLISAPILRMVTATRRLARGELDTRVHVRTRDETASLASSFNEMSRALKTRDEELRGHLLYIQKILQNATTGVLSLDRRGTIVTINDAGQQLLPSGKPPEVGDALQEVLDGSPALKELSEAYRRARRLPDQESTVEVAVRLEEERRLRAVFLPFAPEPGEPGQIVLIEDITDVARSNRLSAWAEMARGIAHEIKNPLTPIQLAVGHLRRVYAKRGPDTRLDDPRFQATLQECLDIILEQVEHLRQISKDFSTYARIPESRREPTDPAQLIRGVLRPYTGLAPESVSFEADLQPDLPPASLDADLMRRTLVNLLENSLQAMPEGGRIRVSAACTRSNGDPWLEIAVSDTGVGVDPEALKRLFEPYFSTKAAGTGLGLAIARKAVEEHGGEIIAESRPGSGTTFRIRIPLRTGETP